MIFRPRILVTSPLIAIVVMIVTWVRGQSPASHGDAAPAPIEYSTAQVISSNDSSAVIAEKAAKVLPRPNQTAWMRLERTFFIHFGVNTFRGVEWGSGREESSIFNPSDLDANQWISAIKDAGGTTPTTNSTVYRSPISLPSGGTVQAACLTPEGGLGIVGSRSFAGLAPIGWKIADVDSEETTETDNAAANAIDGNPSTFWHTRWNADLALPHSLTIDMGSSRRIGGFAYLPRQDGNLNGIVENYRFETSTDGSNWITNVASGRFGNIRNNPVIQEVPFAPVSARFFRFTALREINTNGWTSAVEISVLSAEPEEGR